MSTKDEIIQKLGIILEKDLEMELPGELKESDRLYEDLGIDSIMVLQLIVYIEEQFAVSVPEENVDPATYQTLGAIVDFILELQSQVV